VKETKQNPPLIKHKATARTMTSKPEKYRSGFEQQSHTEMQ